MQWRDTLKIVVISAISLAIVAGAYLLGYARGIKNRATMANTGLERLDRRVAIKSQIAKDSDVSVATYARKSELATSKTAVARFNVEKIKNRSAHPEEPTPNRIGTLPDSKDEQIKALNILVEAQDSEIINLKQERTELYRARDSWKIAYEAELARILAQDVAHQAAISAEKGNRIKIGCVSFGIGIIAGVLGRR